jgi:hypothetical protein
MEQLKLARGPIRRRATLLCNEMEELLEAIPVHLTKVEAKLQLINERNERLLQYDSEIMDLLLAEEDEGDDEETAVDRELVATEEYQMKIKEIQIQTEKVLRPRPVSAAAIEYSTCSGASFGGKKKTYKLPKIEITKFYGELTEWLSFWSQFSKIHEDEDLHDSDKFQYLRMNMLAGTRGHDLVASYPQTGENYPKVIAALQQRFGDKKLLGDVFT